MLFVIYILVATSVVSGWRLECRHDQYYDRVVDRCEPCTSICLNAEVTGTLTECRQHCPAYTPQPKLKRKDKERKQEQEGLSTPVFSLVICLPAIAIILAAAAICLWCGRLYVHKERMLHGGNMDKSIQEQGPNQNDAVVVAVVEKIPFLTDSVDKSTDDNELCWCENASRSNGELVKAINGSMCEEIKCISKPRNRQNEATKELQPSSAHQPTSEDPWSRTDPSTVESNTKIFQLNYKFIESHQPQIDPGNCKPRLNKHVLAPRSGTGSPCLHPFDPEQTLPMEIIK